MPWFTWWFNHLPVFGCFGGRCFCFVVFGCFVLPWFTSGFSSSTSFWLFWLSLFLFLLVLVVLFFPGLPCGLIIYQFLVALVVVVLFLLFLVVLFCPGLPGGLIIYQFLVVLVVVVFVFVVFG